jgi:RNA polymerase subunit RPABC4/transcription elongation factor Spt4
MAKMIQCKSCSREIASNAKSCPGCGAKNKKPIYKRAWFIILAVVIVGGTMANLGGNDNTSTSNGKEASSVKEVEKAKYEIVGDVTSETDSAATYIKGVIKNNSGKDVSYVQITYNLFDKDGNQIGTALDNINNLAKDGTWKFKAIGLDVDGEIDTFKLGEITGF